MPCILRLHCEDVKDVRFIPYAVMKLCFALTMGMGGYSC